MRGKTATAVVRAQGRRGGPPVTDTIRLVRQDGRYKIVSAGKEPGEKCRGSASQAVGASGASASSVASKSVCGTPPMQGEVAPASR